MNRFISGILITGLLTTLLAGGWAWGLSSDKRQPLHISSDSAKINNNSGISVYNGDVKVTQGTMKLTGNIVTVYTESKKIVKVLAEGNAKVQAFFTEDQDNNEGPVKAWANTLTYDVKKENVILKGRAKVTRHNQVFNGEYMMYNKHLQTVQAHGNNKNQQVHIVIQPEKKNPATRKSDNQISEK